MRSPDTSQLGKIIRTCREARQMTMTQLAEKCGFSSRHLADIENGKTNPSYEILHIIIHELAISADILFYPDMPLDDKRFKLLLIQLERCSEEEQEIVLRVAECLTYNLTRHY